MRRWTTCSLKRGLQNDYSKLGYATGQLWPNLLSEDDDNVTLTK